MLLQVTLDLPPSVNGRTKFTAHGGREATHVTAYKWVAKNQLQWAWNDTNALQEARTAQPYLRVRMWACIPAPRKVGTPGVFGTRDIDNMLQVVCNLLKEYLQIDDSKIVDLRISKHLLPVGSRPYLNVTVETAFVSIAPQPYSRVEALREARHGSKK